MRYVVSWADRYADRARLKWTLGSWNSLSLSHPGFREVSRILAALQPVRISSGQSTDSMQVRHTDVEALAQYCFFFFSLFQLSLLHACLHAHSERQSETQRKKETVVQMINISCSFKEKFSKKKKRNLLWKGAILELIVELSFISCSR